ncbi:response regulator transcription factor [Serratia marcescens]|jgi:DNA-binding NarL/FixJ family response regulator|uniref:helix-turn-helix transcriptional regulator n=1 Tax=Serratia marcescens TaxID=615 RepID=UPI00192CD627|nr:LuxR C-terminal-related transcriptional regulator [Serratia marcescens]MBL5820288.1 response regulator transcription factor [Serratia marcescens]HEJ9033130.1 response regulator transcription factor [Serratia marcescens]
MVKADFGDALLFFEPSYLVRRGMEAFLVTQSSDSYFIDTLRELEGALKEGKPRALIMELYHQSEYLYDVLRLVLTAKNVWPEIPLVIFTTVEHPGILALLAADARIAIVAKEDPLHCLSDAIAAAGKFSGYRSPHIRARLVHSTAALSDGEWRVLAMMVAGASPRSIATVTRRSYKTISSHKLNIMRKLGLNQAGFMRLILTLRTRYPS